ncbi:DUF3883 domain-containing protein [Bacillus sp. ISL-4]|uniref:DUF3883 domain-containing protein n=1 Tax=Bacillus sp. ISL-4 TaxID=2819125 RepID=UPI001BE739F3|nr:DUF3883 domain-containing protein [Bacillus sp. ISL-4]MBT2667323.1 DUF3883 domain-containing protein [Bacillus sp. ISL-4]MBT2669441.1 DUF3883 domain-containing protein [Streptomyces sp. ISL-14]
MVKRENVKAEEFEDWLDENSHKIIDDFLSVYKEKENHSSAIRVLLYHDIVKDDVTDLTFEDYIKVVPTDNKDLNPQQRYKSRFFQYLYALDYLKQPFGFDSVMHKQTLQREFNKEKKSKLKTNAEKSVENALTIEELMLIQNVLDADSTKLDTLKMQFCWYALFELGLQIEEVRKRITSENYFNGKIKTSEGVFDIPQKFHQMFIELSNRDSNYNGFATLEGLIANLGKVANLSRKLKPNMVKNARKTTTLSCGNCFKEFSNESHNWASVNNRIVCVTCAESIKKKLDFKIENKPFENTDVDTKSNQELSILFTYEDLRTKLKNKKVDYLKLHELQMEIGKLGEAYVYQIECENLKGTKYLDLVDQRKAENPANGYDILSYTRDGKPIHIEVKATIGKEDIFHLSEYERNTAESMKKQGLTYVVYFVKEVMSYNPNLEVIEDIITNQEYIFQTTSWEVSKKITVK